LQVDGLGVEGARPEHGREHLQQFVVVVGECRQVVEWAALRAQLPQVLNLKLRHRSHSCRSLDPGSLNGANYSHGDSDLPT
jgi:hypothetical protein